MLASYTCWPGIMLCQTHAMRLYITRLITDQTSNQEAHCSNKTGMLGTFAPESPESFDNLKSRNRAKYESALSFRCQFLFN